MMLTSEQICKKLRCKSATVYRNFEKRTVTVIAQYCNQAFASIGYCPHALAS